MESRESSSPTSSVDNGCVSLTASLAKEAASLFHSANFADCFTVLNQLMQKKQGDPKVIHNIAIVKNFLDGFVYPKKFLGALNDVKKQSEELANASRENVKGISNLESNAVAVSSVNSTLALQSSNANSSAMVLNAEYETHVTSFNMAVTWFNLCVYSKSFSILGPMYQNLAPISEGIAFRICLLLLDVSLLSQRASISAGIIDYLEKLSSVSHMINQCENVSSAQQLPQLLTKTSSVPNNTPVPDISNADFVTNSSEISLSRSLSEEADYENLFSTLDMTGQNLSRPSIIHSSNNILRSQVDDLFPVIDLRLKLHLYKVRFFLLTRNPKEAKREVKMAMNIARGNNSIVLFLKSQLEYARGNHPKAIKLLMAISNRAEIGTSVMFYNNLGCIHYQLGKHQTSAVYFSKALSSCSVIRKEKPQTLTSFSMDKSFLVAYNCGMQYLASGKPILAARCFHNASLMFYNRPLLWLRIAECCLMALEKGLLDSNRVPFSRSEVKVHVIGKGKWRNLVMEDEVLRNSQADSVGERDSLHKYDRGPKLSMCLARHCLKNALELLNSSESVHMSSGLPSDLATDEGTYYKSTNCKIVSGGDSLAQNVAVGSGQIPNGDLKEQKNASTPDTNLRNFSSDYEDICRKEIQKIRQSVLANLAYVELALGNPLKALSTARTLLETAECSRIYIFLANIYAAEALCLLYRGKEAADQLLVYLSSGNNDEAELPFTQEDCVLWREQKTVDREESYGGAVATNNALVDVGQVLALDPEEARGTLYANLATMFAIQGNLEQSYIFVSQALSSLPNSPAATLTAVYLDLMLGKPHEAIAKLKKCSHISFLPGSFAVERSS